jgi:hypothetical protein
MYSKLDLPTARILPLSRQTAERFFRFAPCLLIHADHQTSPAARKHLEGLRADSQKIDRVLEEGHQGRHGRRQKEIGTKTGGVDGVFDA